MARPIAIPVVRGIVPQRRGEPPAGADGLLIEVDPDRALSDGARSLDFDRFERLPGQLRSLARPLGWVV